MTSIANYFRPPVFFFLKKTINCPFIKVISHQTMATVCHMKNGRKSVEHKGKRLLGIFRKNVFIKKYI